MKHLCAILVLTAASLLALQPAAAAPAPAPGEASTKNAPADRPIPKSTFGIPAKPQDGHDPFFPVSDRLFAAKTAPKPASSSLGSAVVFNGISGSQDHRLAMINGRTFAEGEEAPVNTAAGRVRVLLVAIKGDVAVVEIAGERRELMFQGR